MACQKRMSLYHTRLPIWQEDVQPDRKSGNALDEQSSIFSPMLVLGGGDGVKCGIARPTVQYLQQIDFRLTQYSQIFLASHWPGNRGAV